jgi:hypothetical protein
MHTFGKRSQCVLKQIRPPVPGALTILSLMRHMHVSYEWGFGDIIRSADGFHVHMSHFAKSSV